MNLFKEFKKQVNKKSEKQTLPEVQAKIQEIEIKVNVLRKKYNEMYVSEDIQSYKLAPEQETLMQEIQFLDARLTQLRKVEGHLKPLDDETRRIDRMVEHPFDREF
jgi:hypothetical protein